MIDILEYIEKNKIEFFDFLNSLLEQEKKLLIIGETCEIFRNYKNDEPNVSEELEEVINLLQEIIIHNHTIYLDVRVKIGHSSFFIANIEEMVVEKISIKEYLIAKEKFVNPDIDDDILTLNFKPFYENYPSVRDYQSIGDGVEYLNKFLSSKMFNDIDKWKEVLFNYVKLHKYDGQQLILNDRIKSPDHLITNIKKTINTLGKFDKKERYENIKHELQSLGFEKGLGKDVKEIKSNLQLLDNLLHSPDNTTLKEFLAKIPMIFNIAIVSPHGYFAQQNVLGLPDSGGQIVYILDQVKALEKTLIDSLNQAGINILPKIIILTRLIPNAGNTKCNQRLEKVVNTKNTWILRVPFRTHNPRITDNWISRFEIWPYLEEFAEDAEVELKAEFKGNPDLIVGNYSDGNLVSYLLSKKFNVTQCCIAHALEKSKYLFSDLYWKDMEDQYNFSTQFTADLIAMNSSNFQITSTYQEIAGTEYSVGQYETHKHFTLPGLYRVENGVDLYNIKFNIISPGVNERMFFPYTKTKQRNQKSREYLTKLLFENMEDEEVFGELENPDLVPIFSLARLDKNKNLTSLVRWFGESEELQQRANLFIVAGKIDAANSSDKEEIEQIHLMWSLIDEFKLHNKIRWIGKLFRKNDAGEVYRIIAERKGLFVQPGLFEGFGLTVLEAMISGIPVIATKYGGPLEIIQNGVSGFHIDPINKEESKQILLDVVTRFNQDENYWKEISQNSIKRVNEAYNWKLYSNKLLTNSKIFGFWKYLTDLDMKDMEAYLDIVYHLLFKPRAEKLLEKHNNM
ncbi:MAG: sucrose synthase [Ignavibacteriae bacterium]|nr:sucrose synthase [Ignavibacteriota bacterium]NOH00107.1 sucrose synthase [Ignavibacteriota bacterium]